MKHQLWGRLNNGGRTKKGVKKRAKCDYKKEKYNSFYRRLYFKTAIKKKQIVPENEEAFRATLLQRNLHGKPRDRFCSFSETLVYGNLVWEIRLGVRLKTIATLVYISILISVGSAWTSEIKREQKLERAS